MITYNEIYEALRNERYSEQLQILPKKFVSQVAEYFKNKEEFSSKDNVLFSDLSIKNKKKLENAITLFKELMLRRRKKILNLAFVASETGISKKDFENLLDFEKELFEEITKSLSRAEKNLKNLLVGEEIKESRYKLVRFLEDVSEFIDIEGESIGPFQKGEVANLEKEIVKILSNDNRIEVIDDE